MTSFGLRLVLGVALATGLAGAGLAQPDTAGPNAVLFDQPNFQGRSITISQGSADLEAQGFSAMAMSGHFEGDWTICARPAFRGHCDDVHGDVVDLAQLGLSRRIVSLRHDPSDAPAAPPPSQPAAPDGYFDRPPPPPARPEGVAVPNQGVAGHSVVFFYRPQQAGADIPGATKDLADTFCQGQGLGAAAYWDTDGRILRDVLCKRD
jgi:hypothetical protein